MDQNKDKALQRLQGTIGCLHNMIDGTVRPSKTRVNDALMWLMDGIEHVRLIEVDSSQPAEKPTCPHTHCDKYKDGKCVEDAAILSFECKLDAW